MDDSNEPITYCPLPITHYPLPITYFINRGLWMDTLVVVCIRRIEYVFKPEGQKGAYL
jgi:hypothetical protein